VTKLTFDFFWFAAVFGTRMHIMRYVIPARVAQVEEMAHGERRDLL